MKKILCLLLSVLMIAGALSLSAFAANDAVVYIAFNGDNANDGKTAATPKKSLDKITGSGAMGMLKTGGTLVVSQKLYIGGDYTWELPEAVTITANYGGTDYKNAEPANNPASGVMKFATNKILTIKSDVTLDDIILFQEAGQNTILVEDGATLTITDKVICTSKKPYYMNIEVMSGGKAVINGGIFSEISGDGDIRIAEGVKVLSSAAEEPEKPAEVKEGVAFINFNAGSDDNSGADAESPKKSFGTLTGNGAMSLLGQGGTLVITGRAYIGKSYDLPALSNELLITSNYDGTDYKKATPDINNPECAFKMASGATLSLNSDVRFDDLVLFQEGAQNTIEVKAGTTLFITDKVVLMSKPGVDYHFRIVIESGATAFLSEEAQNVMTIENNGTLETYQSATPVTPAEPESKFKPTRTYENQFTDVPAAAWFLSYVKTAYEYGLASGTTKTAFSPDGTFTVAQALTAAVNIHNAYTGKTVRAAATGEAWYTPYVEYCVANGIIKDGQFTDYNKNITRGDMAIVFANILPDSEYTAIRTYTLSDMNDTRPSAAAVKKLAEAGIVGGSNGKYKPNDPIKRSEACVIFTRIAVASMRDSKAN